MRLKGVEKDFLGRKSYRRVGSSSEGCSERCGCLATWHNIIRPERQRSSMHENIPIKRASALFKRLGES